MSPRSQAQGIRWPILGPAVGLWLAAVIALSAMSSPTTAIEAPAEQGTQAVTISVDRHGDGIPEAPVLTLVLAGLIVAYVATRPAARAVVRSRRRR